MFLLVFLQGTMLGTVLGMSVSGLLCDIKLDNGWPFIFYIFGKIKIEIFSYLTAYYMFPNFKITADTRRKTQG